LRIAFILFNFLPYKVGGTEIATYYLAKELAEEGHDVYVLTSHFKDAKFYERMNGIRVIRISWFFNKLFDSEIKFLGFHEFIVKCLSILRKIDPDIIHSQGFFNDVVAFIVNKILGKRYIIGVVGSDINVAFPLKNFIFRELLLRAEAILTKTREMKGRIKKLLGINKKIHVVYNGVDTDLFSIDRYLVCREKTEKKRILFVGGLRRIKGVRYLIMAMKLVLEKTKDVELVIVGDGPERVFLKKLAEKLNVHKYIMFVGRVKHEKIPLYMLNSDIFVLPSLYEGLPNVLIEALAMGLPVVATSVGGVPEIIQDDVNGYLVEPKSVRGLADKICKLLLDDKKRGEIRNNNLKKAKFLSWSSVAKKIEKIYREITSNYQS